MTPIYQTLKQIVLCVIFLFLSITLQAQTPNFPNTMTYQGKLIENGNPFTGSATLTFELINSNTNGILWTETQNVLVADGLYSVVLGIQNPINSSLFTLAANTQLRISVNNNLLSPNVALTPVPYAHTAATVLPRSIRPLNIVSGGLNKVLTTDATGNVVWLDQSALGGGTTVTPTTYTAINGLTLTPNNAFALGGTLLLPNTEIYLNGRNLNFFNLSDNGTPTSSSSNLKIALGNTSSDTGGNIAIKAQNSTSTASIAQGGDVVIESGRGVNNGQIILEPTDGRLILGNSTGSPTAYSSFDLNGVMYLEDMNNTTINTSLGLYQQNGNLFWNGTALGLSSYSFLNGLNQSGGDVTLGGLLTDDVSLSYSGSDFISFNLDLGSSDSGGGDVVMKAQGGTGGAMSEDSGGDVVLQAGHFNSDNVGAKLDLYGGSNFSGGGAYLKAGEMLNSSGASIDLYGGEASNGGTLVLRGGSTINVAPGDIDIKAGDIEDTNSTANPSISGGQLRLNAGFYQHPISETSIQENIYMQSGGGKVLIGFSSDDFSTTTTPNDIVTGGAIYYSINTTSPDNFPASDIRLATRGDVFFEGNLFTNVAVTASDQRLKKNILPLSNSLSNVLALRGVSYDWRIEDFPNYNFDKDRQLGVLAQEVYQIYPEAVEVRPDGYLSVNYSALVPVLIEATKEQQTIIDEQATETQNLKKKVQELEEKLNAVLQLLGNQASTTLEAKAEE